MTAKSICAVVIATNNYAEYAANLIDSLLQTQDQHLTIHLFTDHLLLNRNSTYETVTTHTIYHEPWPMITLRKFEFLSDISEEITSTHIIYIDADALAKSDFSEICESTEITFVSHPGFWRPGEAMSGSGTWEDNLDSLAYVPPTERKKYICGGVWFGPSFKILKMCSLLASRVNKDLQKKVIAIWHDESHLNWFHAKFHSLATTPSYAFVDEYTHLESLFPKIQMLEKPPDWKRE